MKVELLIRFVRFLFQYPFDAFLISGYLVVLRDFEWPKLYCLALHFRANWAFCANFILHSFLAKSMKLPTKGIRVEWGYLLFLAKWWFLQDFEASIISAKWRRTLRDFLFTSFSAEMIHLCDLRPIWVSRMIFMKCKSCDFCLLQTSQFLIKSRNIEFCKWPRVLACPFY